MPCIACGTENSAHDTYCCCCGSAIDSGNIRTPAPLHADSPHLKDIASNNRAARRRRTDRGKPAKPVRPEGEYRHVTVLFADLTGTSEIAGDMNPEAAQQLMSGVFREVHELVTRHGGVVERFFGDEVLVFFGLPTAREDDSIRAVKLAEDIHRTMARLSADADLHLDRRLNMHIGISTGPVVTGDEWIGDHRHGIAGHTIHVAAQLAVEATSGMTLVGPETHACAEAFFTFAPIRPLQMKGESEPLPAYRLLGRRYLPRKVRRQHGLRASFTGRAAELAQLRDAARRLEHGDSVVVGITGGAGQGKSRLVEAFRQDSSVGGMRWLEGHAYQCARNIPFGPLVQMLNQLYDIPPSDTPGAKAARLGRGMEHVTALDQAHRACIESLYLSPHPALDGVSPESWQRMLQEAIREILAVETAAGPTVLCFEDLHWVDPSFMDLFQSTLTDLDGPVMILCTYRPIPGKKPLGRGAEGQGASHVGLVLPDLSESESAEMVMDMLGVAALPENLAPFVNERAGGNPFFLEELVNALVASRDLASNSGRWEFSQSIHDYRIPATVQGLVTSRIDRLPSEIRTLLQAAAVIGATFHHDLLADLTGASTDDVEEALYALGDTELVRPMSAPGEKTFAFTHTIVHDVVYEGLLVSDRRRLHERTARLLERRAEKTQSIRSEIIAHHFERGRSPTRAVGYLLRAIGDSMKIHAVEEAHRCCLRAYKLLSGNTRRTPEENAQLIDLLIDWFFVYDVRGLFSDILERLLEYEPVAAGMGPGPRLGMYYVCIGWAMQRREQLDPSRQYLFKALHMGEAIEDSRVMGYASACMIWTCTDRGDLNEAISFGYRAESLMQEHRGDQLLVRLVLTGLGIANWFIGNVGACREIGQQMLAFGAHGSDIRTESDGHLVTAMGDFVAGELESVETGCRRAIDVSVGLVHSLNAKFLLAYAYLGMERLDDAGELLTEITDFCDAGGYEYLGSSASALMGVVLAGRGNLRTGFGRLKRYRAMLEKKGKRYHCLVFDYILGSLFLQAGISPVVPAAIRRAIRTADRTRLPFLPFQRAAQYLHKAHAEAEHIGAKNMMGTIALDLGTLYREKGNLEAASRHYEEAAMMFRACGAPGLAERAEAARGELAN